MSRKRFALCLMLAVCGSGAATNNALATGNRDSNPSAGPVIAGETSVVQVEPAAVKPAECEPPQQVAADDKPKEPPAAEPPAKPERSLTSQEAFAEAQKLFQKNDIAGVVRVLEQALPGNPEDVNLLLSLARFTSTLASTKPEKPDYAQYRKAAEYLRRALKANPVFAANPAVRTMASPIYYKEACALALDNRADQALKSLGEAVDCGFKDFAQIERDADLMSVRALAGYADFKNRAEETLRAQAEAARAQLNKQVEGLFAQNDPFDFDFKLTDTDGKPIAMADFAGKVLIVDVWGTWCPPCRMEVPHFVALQKKFEEAGLVIVGLNSERAADQEQALKLVQDFRQQNGMDYRCALVSGDTLQDIPDFNAFPTTMFFDRDGNVRAKVVGYHDYEVLEIMVRKLLDEKIDSTAGGGSAKRKARLSFGMAGFVRRTPWPVAEQGGVQGHFWNSAFSPDGQTYMVFGDSGPRGIVRLWDLTTGKPLPELHTDKDVWFSNARFLPDGKQVVTAYAKEKDVYLWDVATGGLAHRFQGHTADGVAAFVSHDGRRLVSTGEDQSLRLWDVAKLQAVWTQDVSGEKIVRVAFSPDDRLILTSGADRDLRIRELATGAIVAKLKGHTASCAGDFSPDGKQVLSWGEDGQVRLWDTGTAKTVQSLNGGRTDAVRQAWHLEGGREVLTWGKDLVFRVRDASSGQTLREITVSETIAPGWSEAVVSPDGHRLLVVNSDGPDVRLVDLISGKELYRSEKGKLRKARGFAFSPNGRHVAAGSFRTGVYLIELPVSSSESALQTPSRPAERSNP